MKTNFGPFLTHLLGKIIKVFLISHLETKIKTLIKDRFKATFQQGCLCLENLIIVNLPIRDS